MAPEKLESNGATLLSNGMVKVRRSTMPGGTLMREKVRKHQEALKVRRANADVVANAMSPTTKTPPTATEKTQNALFGPDERKRQQTREKILQKHMQKLASVPGQNADKQ